MSGQDKRGGRPDRQCARGQGDDLVVVVSAMSGETNRLTSLAHEVSDLPPAREMDVLLSTGEQVTIALLSMALNARGCKAKSYTGSQVRIRTDSVHGKARIQDIDDATGTIRPLPMAVQWWWRDSRAWTSIRT